MAGKILLVVLDVIFVVAFTYLVLVTGFRIYWRWKVKKLRGTPIPRTFGEFGRLKKGKGIIYFYSPRCKPCKLVEPVIKKLSKEFKKVHFVKVNVLENPEIAREFGILATPSIVITMDGHIKEVLAGPVSERTLRSHLSGGGQK